VLDLKGSWEWQPGGYGGGGSFQVTVGGVTVPFRAWPKRNVPEWDDLIEKDGPLEPGARKRFLKFFDRK
jgi:hypothetical protein